MTRHTTTTWTCDRCGERTITDAGKQPETWSRIRLTTPPLRADDPYLDAQLCGDCTDIIRTVLGDPTATKDRIPLWEAQMRRNVTALNMEVRAYKKTLEDIKANNQQTPPQTAQPATTYDPDIAR